MGMSRNTTAQASSAMVPGVTGPLENTSATSIPQPQQRASKTVPIHRHLDRLFVVLIVLTGCCGVVVLACALFQSLLTQSTKPIQAAAATIVDLMASPIMLMLWQILEKVSSTSPSAGSDAIKPPEARQ
jgi:hypothetical protein